MGRNFSLYCFREMKQRCSRLCLEWFVLQKCCNFCLTQSSLRHLGLCHMWWQMHPVFEIELKRIRHGNQFKRTLTWADIFSLSDLLWKNLFTAVFHSRLCRRTCRWLILEKWLYILFWYASLFHLFRITGSGRCILIIMLNFLNFGSTDRFCWQLSSLSCPSYSQLVYPPEIAQYLVLICQLVSSCFESPAPEDASWSSCWTSWTLGPHGSISLVQWYLFSLSCRLSSPMKNHRWKIVQSHPWKIRPFSAWLEWHAEAVCSCEVKCQYDHTERSVTHHMELEHLCILLETR